MKNNKILIIQDTLSNYSIPNFNLISDKFDFTVAYSYCKCDLKDAKFKTINCPIREIGPFAFYEHTILKEMKKYDVVILSPYFKYINLIILTYLYGRQKTIYYGIGVSASYKNHYNSKEWVTKLFSLYLKTIGAAVFYSEYPINIYSKLGVKKNKMFVANNTVEVLEQKNAEKNKLLFIGTLYKEKGIVELLFSYLKAYRINNDIYNLEIIGDGPEKEWIKNFVKSNSLGNKVILRGAIYDEKILCCFFSEAIACISPSQAGLSVLKSMGYGVPFVTKKNSITGGEIFNIANGINGVIYDSDDELSDIILNTYNDRSKYIALGNNAKKYYNEHATIEIMSKGFIDAINFVANEIKE